MVKYLRGRLTEEQYGNGQTVLLQEVDRSQTEIKSLSNLLFDMDHSAQNYRLGSGPQDAASRTAAWEAGSWYANSLGPVNSQEFGSENVSDVA